MSDIGIGAVGAAIIAGLVSLLGLIIGKEQKVSEFRQAWIDDLRKCFVDYLVQINAVVDATTASKGPAPPTTDAVLENFKGLNRASHGIKFRVNPDEPLSKAVLSSMDAFEQAASSATRLTTSNVPQLEMAYNDAVISLLKNEWKRVKKGERTYVATRWIVVACILLMTVVFMYLWYHSSETGLKSPGVSATASINFGVPSSCVAAGISLTNPSTLVPPSIKAGKGTERPRRYRKCLGQYKPWERNKIAGRPTTTVRELASRDASPSEKPASSTVANRAQKP